MAGSTNFFAWWYIESPKNVLNFCLSMIKYTYHLFSIPYLVKTLFAPWKRDITSPINPSIRDLFMAFVYNVIARLIGFVVRFFTIIAGLIIISITVALLVAFFILFLLFPILSIVGLIYGLWLLLM